MCTGDLARGASIHVGHQICLGRKLPGCSNLMKAPVETKVSIVYGVANSGPGYG